jgi:hypothetical protein
VTDDWYSQDRRGNMWYLGERTTEYENGRPAKPKVGLRYRQEYYKGHAEDRAQVLSTKEEVELPFGHFRRGRVLMTRDLNPLEPKVLEYKFYARRIGPVLGWVFPAEATARSS